MELSYTNNRTLLDLLKNAKNVREISFLYESYKNDISRTFLAFFNKFSKE